MKGLIASTLILMTQWGPEAWAEETYASALKYLEQVKEENLEALDQIQVSTKAILESPDSPQFDTSMTLITTKRLEYSLRQEFLDRLHFMVQNYKPEGQFREFMERILLHMASIEASSLPSNERLWRFMSYASLVIKNLPEKQSAVLPTVIGYMKYASITQPVEPQVYLGLMDYSNGLENEPAKSIERDSIGDLVSQKVAQVEAEIASREGQKNFADRKPKLRGVFEVVELVPQVSIPMEELLPENNKPEPHYLAPGEEDLEFYLIPKEEARTPTAP